MYQVMNLIFIKTNLNIIIINQIKMTLFIKIRQYTKLAQSGYLFVEGSKAGHIKTQLLKSGSHKLDKSFLIMCASDDKLRFKLCKDLRQFQSGEYYGKGQLSVPLLLYKNKGKLNLDNDFFLDVDLIGGDNSIVGTIACDITYDKVSHYQGELASGVAEYKKRIAAQKMKLYKGKCPTKNLFSMLDPSCEGQKNRFIQSYYADDVQ